MKKFMKMTLVGFGAVAAMASSVTLWVVTLMSGL